MKLKTYPVHPCVKCSDPTDSKNYCPPCLKTIKHPQFVFAKRDIIAFSEPETRQKTRNESVNNLRG